MTRPEVSLSWVAVLNVASETRSNLRGDKILLPPSALQQLLSASTVTNISSRSAAPIDPFVPYSVATARTGSSEWRDNQQQLPQPLTFRLVNPKNGNVVYAGIWEFSADEGEVDLSPFLLEALAVTAPSTKNSNPEHQTPPIALNEYNESISRIVVHAKQLPKGRYVRLRPLEAGYNPHDWKALLERHLRENYTTLTAGEIFTVQGSKSEEFKFLIDKFVPEGEGICVVDTDLEVDIEALNEEQARETLKKILARSHLAPGTTQGSTIGGDLDMWKPSTGQVLDGDYVDYTLQSWDRSRGISIKLTGEDVEIFVGPYSSRQRARPREDEHIWGEFGAESVKTLAIHPNNVEVENAEALYISVHARGEGRLHKYSLDLSSLPTVEPSNEPTDEKYIQVHNPGEEQCQNCLQWVPSPAIMLHENFCLRNNITCSRCNNVFQKTSQDWKDHWHCEHDSTHGNTIQSRIYHNEIFHTSRSCPNCHYIASNFRDLAAHRTSVCPGKIILCQFCHLEVPQEGDPDSPSPEALISGLTAHELADGARTTNCHLCSMIVRFRDMTTHLKHHELDKTSRPKPAICRNMNCARTLDGVGKNGKVGTLRPIGPCNDLELCRTCFGPLYVSMYDPEGKAMKRRVERRYLSQLISGCGKSWCNNQYCKTAQKLSLTSQTALPIARPLADTLRTGPAFFCVDEGSQRRRQLAEMMAAEKIFHIEWCIAALEAEGDIDGARKWLQNWAPKL